MPVACYQISEFEQAEGVLTVSTYSLAAFQANIEDLLRLVAPTVRYLGPSGDFFDPGYRYEVAPGELPRAMALLQSHLAPTVTAMLDCSVAVCLDFYAHPNEAGQWVRTEVGRLVHSAKYGGNLRQAGPLLAARVTEYVRLHPIMSQAVAVAAMPSSQSLGVADRGLPAGLATWVSRELGIPVAPLARTSVTPHAQKNLPAGQDADANQAHSMGAVLDASGLVLVLDDLMEDGSTVREATRALGAAGAMGVASLTLAKDRKGTRRYQFP
jgi:predicted amidophosphoribosyltransferase